MRSFGRTKTHRFATALLVAMAAAWLMDDAHAAEEETVQHPNNRAAWMAEGSFGVMTHYLISPKGDTEAEKTAAFNRTVDDFDLDHYVDQVASTGADWLIFTIGQNTGYYSSPNAWLDARLPGHTSKRDLVLELGKALHARGLRLIVYLPVEVAGQSDAVKEAFAWNPADQTEYLRRYQAFVRTYSEQYGKYHDGWWFDGCYPPVTQGKWDWAPWCEAARAGNPDAALAFSDAAFCIGKKAPVTPLQDYHAGEVHLLEDGKIRYDFLSGDVYETPEGHLRKRGQEPEFYMPDSQFIDGVQWHALVPIDSTFNPAVPAQHYPDEELFQFVRDCKAVKGAVTLNVPVDNGGHIPEETVAQLRRLSEALGS